MERRGSLFAITTGLSMVQTNTLAYPGDVGIGTTTPSAKLHVNGTVRFQGLAGVFNDVLVTDANGNVFYRNLPANVWDGDDVNDTNSQTQLMS